MKYSLKTALIIFLFFPITLFAQKDKDPIWYTMMHDPNVNFYKAVQAYKDYWKGKKMPPNKEQRETEEYKNYFKSMKSDEKAEYERIFIMNKEFKSWMQEEESWVQPDGRILSQEEKMAIINGQKQELKTTEKKNGKN